MSDSVPAIAKSDPNEASASGASGASGASEAEDAARWRPHLFGLVFSLIYATKLQSLELLAFMDRENYLIYAQHSQDFYDSFANQGLTALLANEPLWLQLNIWLAGFLAPETVVRTLIFIGAFVLPYSLIRIAPKQAWWIALFFFAPYLVKNHITHLRQGFAMAIFFLGFSIRLPVLRWSLMGTAPFLHSAFLFILPLVTLARTTSRFRLSPDTRLPLMIAASVVVSLASESIANFSGARQAEVYDFEMRQVTGLGFLFWTSIGSLFVLSGKSWIGRHQEALSILIFYLVSYFFLEVTARIFEAGLPLVLLAGLALSGWRRQAFLTSFICFSLIEWQIRLSSSTPF